MKKIITLTALTLAIGLTACQQTRPVTSLPPGEYEKTTSTTNAQGTEVTKTSKTEVRRDDSGRKTATVDTKVTKDPQGLFNKETTYESHREIR